MAQKHRSPAGSGTIRKKTIVKNGKEYTSWEGRVTLGFDPLTGKQKQKSVSGKTQREVAQKIRELTTSIDKGIYREPVKMTVGQWLDIWLDQFVGSVKPRTIEAYDCSIRTHLKPAFGDVKLDALTAADIQKLYIALQRKEKPLSAKSIKNLHGVLHRALQQAVELGYLHSNPSDPCKLPRIEKKDIQPLDEEAIRRFLQAVQGRRYEYLYLVTLFTGMREGEVLGLKWENIDWENGTILIGQQLQRKHDGTGEYTLISPKNGKHRRITPAPFVLDVLRKQQELQAQWKRDAYELWEDDGFVFSDEVGHHLSCQTVYLHFKKIAAEIGCPKARFHDLRHSYAVASLQIGDDIKTVQENLGHHTAAFTLDVYGHVTQKMKRDSADRMQQFINSVRGKDSDSEDQ